MGPKLVKFIIVSMILSTGPGNKISCTGLYSYTELQHIAVTTLHVTSAYFVPYTVKYTVTPALGWMPTAEFSRKISAKRGQEFGM